MSKKKTGIPAGILHNLGFFDEMQNELARARALYIHMYGLGNITSKNKEFARAHGFIKTASNLIREAADILYDDIARQRGAGVRALDTPQARMIRKLEKTVSMEDLLILFKKRGIDMSYNVIMNHYHKDLKRLGFPHPLRTRPMAFYERDVKKWMDGPNFVAFKKLRMIAAGDRDE